MNNAIESPLQYFLRTAARGTIIVKHRSINDAENYITVGKITRKDDDAITLCHSTDLDIPNTVIPLSRILQIRVLLFSHLHGEFKV